MASAVSRGGFELIGTASNGREGVRSYVMLEPDFVLLDITMPIMDGLTALKKILAYDPAARVIMCSTLSEESLIIKALQIGAQDYIVKPFHPQRIIAALERTGGATGPGLGV